MSRNPQLNNVESSSFAGKIKAANLPVSETLKGEFEIAPVGIRFWSLVIPANATDKDLSWSFIRNLASKENIRKIALHVNGPMRRSPYDDPDYKPLAPHYHLARSSLSVAMQTLTPIHNPPRAYD